MTSPTGRAVQFDGSICFDAGQVANFDYRDRLKDYKDRFAISVWIYPDQETSGAIVTRMRDNVETTENGLPTNKGYGLFFVDGKVHFNLVSVWADDSVRVETENRVGIKAWHHVLATFDSLEPYEKVQIFVDGQRQKLRKNQPYLFRQFADSQGHLRIGGGGGRQFRFKGGIDEMRIYNALPDRDQRSILACGDSLVRIAGTPFDQRSDGQRLKIMNAWIDRAAPGEIRSMHARLLDLQHQKRNLVAGFPTVMVMEESAEPRPSYLLRRGAYDSPADKVERGVPAVLPPLGKDPFNNRLTFARWLVSSEHPLTARVQVNRFWQMIYGTGLVKTVDDFGTRGELPSHPELLDWLATEFMSTTKWNVKSLLKTIVMSATYRQCSKVTPDLGKRDPENRMLARGARIRLPAEMIRDSALSQSGLLVQRIGGPSVRPYQPDGLYKDMVFSNMTSYGQDHGEGLWRRSLYTFWKRTILTPSMLIMDASPRELCTVREPRTNSPLQALNMMNDVTYVEASRFLAKRMLTEGGNTHSDRLAWGFRVVTSRKPDATERQVLEENLNAQMDYFNRNQDEARKLLSVGEKRTSQQLNAAELAGYSMVASMLFNLDEAITKQ